MARREKSHDKTISTRRRAIVGAVVAGPAVLAATAWLPRTRAAAAGAAERHVTVYRNPGCGCCGAWADHLRESGFTVDIIERGDVTPDKQRFGVPQDFYSCHTARVAGYTIEGHVPAADIERLIVERPDALGLAVPGMPHGSPGMETGRVDRYEVLRFDADGAATVYNRY